MEYKMRSEDRERLVQLVCLLQNVCFSLKLKFLALDWRRGQWELGEGGEVSRPRTYSA